MPPSSSGAISVWARSSPSWWARAYSPGDAGLFGVPAPRPVGNGAQGGFREPSAYHVRAPILAIRRMAGVAWGTPWPHRRPRRTISCMCEPGNITSRRSRTRGLVESEGSHPPKWRCQTIRMSPTSCQDGEGVRLPLGACPGTYRRAGRGWRCGPPTPPAPSAGGQNSRGQVESITAIIKTQGSDTKLVGQMQPYYEAQG